MERHVPCVEQPQLEVTLIALQGIGAESFGGFVLQQAADGLGQR
jgi:hypothetical protein